MQVVLILESWNLQLLGALCAQWKKKVALHFGLPLMRLKMLQQYRAEGYNVFQPAKDWLFWVNEIKPIRGFAK